MEEIRDLEVIKELLDTKQYTRLRQKMAEINTADLAVIMEELEEEDLLKIFRILPILYLWLIGNHIIPRACYFYLRPS